MGIRECRDAGNKLDMRRRRYVGMYSALSLLALGRPRGSRELHALEMHLYFCKNELTLVTTLGR